MKRVKIGPVQKKILILLVGGFSIALSGSPRGQFRVFKQMEREWEKINEQSAARAIRSLYENKLVGYKEKPDGTVKIVINEKGKEKALTYRLEGMKIKIPQKWDSKWRIVIFDIPESFKKAREALRFHLRQLGFYQLQKSVFIFPYQCENEIEFLVEVYGIRQHVRQIIADAVDNELHLKKIFKI
ncbi:MAG: CRISPR-associated endonuclease Cas2 [Candidatus Brennerbacteria bacterium]|nr:CRISPR-associated endonuclease Cas2 [Candidatus Brennerbacteria bacterium]